MSRLADWLAQQAPAWLRGDHGPITASQRRALLAIVRCRTPALGGRVYCCGQCGKRDYAYHSCHHRACPRCGGADTAQWTQRQVERLLPVSYFFWTFTVPEALRALFKRSPQILHPLLFNAATQALQAAAAQKRLLGGELGMIAVLHTWGRQLQHHPHLHVIVPGGGLRPDGQRWQRGRSLEWFLPVAVVQAAFRREFSETLRARAPALHATVPDSVWTRTWNVDVQPVGTGESVVRYLARYVKRTAISDERLLQADEDSVTFRYVDSQTQRPTQCKLGAVEFMRRYLLHVPPPAQHRVRYFGWMHPSARRRHAIVETLLRVVIVVRARPDAPAPWHLRCPHCDAFALVFVNRMARAPPSGSPSCVIAA